MSKKKAFVLRVDPEKLDAVEKWADDEFRSINGQIEWILDQALRKTGRLRKKDKNLAPGLQQPRPVSKTRRQDNKEPGL
jgi:hypothetical protein